MVLLISLYHFSMFHCCVLYHSLVISDKLTVDTCHIVHRKLVTDSEQVRKVKHIAARNLYLSLVKIKPELEGGRILVLDICCPKHNSKVANVALYPLCL